MAKFRINRAAVEDVGRQAANETSAAVNDVLSTTQAAETVDETHARLVSAVEGVGLEPNREALRDLAKRFHADRPVRE